MILLLCHQQINPVYIIELKCYYYTDLIIIDNTYNDTI